MSFKLLSQLKLYLVDFFCQCAYLAFYGFLFNSFFDCLNSASIELLISAFVRLQQQLLLQEVLLHRLDLISLLSKLLE